MKNPRIGIVIVTYNSEKFILYCLDSLVKDEWPNKHIVVVDNASQDNTVAVCESYYSRSGQLQSNNNARIIKNKHNVGFAKGANQGFRYLLSQHCDYFLLLNPDAVVNKNLLAELQKPFLKNSNIGITGCIITYQNSPKTIWFGGGFIHPIFGYTQHKWMDETLKQLQIASGETDFITGCCMLVKKEVIEEVGLLDETFEYYFEDVEFCSRAKNAGFVSYINNKPLVQHSVSASTGILGSNILTPFKAYYYGRNPLLFIKKQRLMVQKLSFLFGYFCISTPYYLFRTKNIDSRLAYLRGMRDGLLN